MEKKIKWNNGLDYQKEISEVALAYVDKIITNHSEDPTNHVKNISVQNRPPYLKTTVYNIKSLEKAIRIIYKSMGMNSKAINNRITQLQ